jgi:hypothetical protein
VKPTKSKELRAGEVAYLINQGSVLLPESAPWLESYKAELSGFPLAPLNDKVDATVHALKSVISQNEFDFEEQNRILLVADPVEEVLSGYHDGPSEGFRRGGLLEDEW